MSGVNGKHNPVLTLCISAFPSVYFYTSESSPASFVAADAL